MDGELTPREHGELVRDLVGALAAPREARTVGIERDVRLQGRLTRHRIDVVWRFEVGGLERTVFFECHRRRGPLEQRDAFAWVGALADLAEAGVHGTGVLVTVTGFHGGARAVADGHGVHVMELRRPTEEDWRGRVRRIVLEVTHRVPDITSVDFDHAPFPAAAGSAEEPLRIAVDQLFVRTGDGERSVQEVMLSGVVAPAGAPVLGMRAVRYEYDPPADLVHEGRVVGRITALHGVAGETERVLRQVIGPVDELLTWMTGAPATGGRVPLGPGGTSGRTGP
ncbi:hypothetical protein GTQ99_21525 [Kineococcus sp. T13]|uniref:hypothetical protein n=1 Tax=Kineococcus vitellinus TaxID=2696565 RepID=UPI001411E219|nr:hypothetical protein [Kineococcus vitellinus]NAZ77968.1 hypothetical protein [Kineococcus vitellinus]